MNVFFGLWLIMTAMTIALCIVNRKLLHTSEERSKLMEKLLAENRELRRASITRPIGKMP